MTRWRSLGASLFITACLLACTGGGGSPPSGGSGGGGSVADVGAFLTQYCDLLAPCCSQVSRQYDQAKCRAFFTAAVGNTTYDGTKAQSCLDGVQAAAQSPGFCDSGNSGTSTAATATCDGVFSKGGSTGGKNPGEPCSTDTDCAPSADGDVRCAAAFVNNATTRQCQVQARGKEGDACIGTRDGNSTVSSLDQGPPPTKVEICWTADGLYCDQSVPTAKKCTRSQDIGGACNLSDTHACSTAGYCDGATKKCVARKAIGDACTQSNECVDTTAYCSTSAKKCAATIPNGGSCPTGAGGDGSAACASKSCVNQTCAASNLSGLSLFVCD